MESLLLRTTTWCGIAAWEKKGVNRLCETRARTEIAPPLHLRASNGRVHDLGPTPAQHHRAGDQYYAHGAERRRIGARTWFRSRLALAE